MELSIVIVNYNTPTLVYNCIKSINKFLDISYEIIVVDNGSTKKIDPKKLSTYLHTTYLPLTSNRGFGAGNNAGSKLAKGRYIFFLNSDTILVDNSVEIMLNFYKSQNKIGALTCLLYRSKNGSIQKRFYGNSQSFSRLLFRHDYFKKIDQKNGFFNAEIVTGAALMIKRTLFIKLKGFDENFFMYLEDDDLCKRLVDLGYRNGVLNTAKIIHFEGKSSNNLTKRRYYYKSQNYYWKKHYGFFAMIFMRSIRIPYKIVQFIVLTLRQ